MNSFILPKPLKYGDTIGVIAPAAAFNEDRFQKGIAVIKSLGFLVDIPDEIFQRKRYLAGNDKLRAQIVQSMLERSDIDGIVCARGGFGTLRMIPYINQKNISPKRIIGFSDITVLLNFLAFQYGWITFHGPVVTMLADADSQTINAFYHALTTPFQKSMPASGEVKILSKGNKQQISGRLWGGNLTTLCHMIGTPYAVNPLNSILFLEDRGESLYRIDRMLSHMRLSGSLDQVKGIILGTFRECGDYEDIYNLILECFGDKIPVIAGIECGHDLPNLTFPLGCWAEMNLETGKIVFSFHDIVT